jgi:hypothetical protein
MKNKSFIVLLFVGVLLIGFSCKTPRTALFEMSKEKRLEAIIQSGLQYENLSSNLRFSIKMGEKAKEITVEGQLRIIKNEAIQLSLRMPLIGSEIFRILITPEKIMIIDRYNRQFISESIENIQSQASFDFDFYSLEALLTNRLFIAGKQAITPQDYATFTIEEDEFFVHIFNTDRQNIDYQFTSDYSNRIQKTQMTHKELESHLQLDYTDWGLTSNRRAFPMTMRLTLAVPNDSYKLNFSFREITVDSEFSIDYNTPNRYKQITLQEVIKLIKAL